MVMLHLFALVIVVSSVVLTLNLVGAFFARWVEWRFGYRSATP